MRPFPALLVQEQTKARPDPLKPAPWAGTRLHPSGPAMLLKVCMAALFLATTARAETVSGTVTAVTVFPGGALVERELRISLPPGESTWEVGPLAPETDPGSLSVRVAEGDASISWVSVRTDHPVEAPTARERELEERLAGLEREAGRASDRSDALGRRLAYIEALTRAAGQTRTDGPPERWRAEWEALSDGAQAALDAIRDAREAERAFRDRARAVREELDALRTRRRQRPWAAVRLAADAGGETVVRLGYRTGRVRWEPRTTARLLWGPGEVVLEAGAVVTQHTGEDWNDVALAVATADPRRAVDPPRPTPWFVDLWEPGPSPLATRAMKAGPAGATELAAAVAGSGVRGDTNAGVTLYRVPGRVSVPSGGRELRFPLTARAFPAEVFLRAFPKEAPVAFVMARFTYDAEGIWPGGRVDRFRGPHFLGTGTRPPLRPGEVVEWAFGPDDQVDVTLRLDRDFKEKTGLLGGKRRVERRYRIDLTNRHPDPVPVEVVIETPVSKDERLTVRLDGSTPPDATAFRDVPGAVLWRRTVVPGSTQRLVLQYALEFPADLRPAGF